MSVQFTIKFFVEPAVTNYFWYAFVGFLFNHRFIKIIDEKKDSGTLPPVRLLSLDRQYMDCGIDLYK